MKSLICTLILALPLYTFSQSTELTLNAQAEEPANAVLVNHSLSGAPSAQLARSVYEPEQLLQLSSFVAKPHHVSVLLSWVIANPSESISFIVERALDNAPWEKVGIVTAAEGQREFSFWDVRVEPGAAYQYRLVNESGNGVVRASQPVILEVDTPIDEYLMILGLIGIIGYFGYKARHLIN